MPTGPKGEKRPADVIGSAVKVMRILTGDEPEDYGKPYLSPVEQAKAQVEGWILGVPSLDRRAGENSV